MTLRPLLLSGLLAGGFLSPGCPCSSGGGSGGSSGGVGSGNGDPLLVSTQSGLVRGTEVGGLFRAYGWLGVPFAKPPVGELRWRPPQDPDPWSGTLETASYGSPCAQRIPNPAGVQQADEDCLHLNVFAPKDRPGPLPVMVWFHGGSNDYNSSSFTVWGIEDLFVTRGNVILVTANYRLGLFGWMAHPALTREDLNQSSGNYGLLDQIQALRWVQQNISGFGGDPGRVTVFGGSSGAIDVCALIASPLAAGLFQGAIMQSGPCAARTRSDMELVQGIPVADAAGCTSPDPADPSTAACLRGLSWQTLTRIEESLGESIGGFLPKIDGWALPSHPEQSMQAGQHNPVPAIIGSQADDTFRWPGPAIETFDDFVAQVRPILLDLGIPSDQIAATVDTLLALYPPSLYGGYFEAFLELQTDFSNICPDRRIARTLAAGPAPWVGWYVFAHTLSGEYSKYRASHTLIGVFWNQAITVGQVPADFQGSGDYVPSPDDLAVATDLLDYWTTFAATGNPNSGKSPFWPSVAPGVPTPQLFLPSVQSPPAFKSTECDFWDALVQAARGF